MATSSEDVLLMVPHVRLKKNDGVLYLMNERLGWMVGSKSSFTISHKYADIKIQKISPEGKSKVQLQVCLHDGSATTFQFVNPIGTAQQIKDRDSVKDALQQLLPKFKKPVNKDLEEKNKLLSDNPQLLQLYVDLVISQVITAEEFWSEHATPFIKQQTETTSSKQDIGVSSAFLADIKPQADGCNGLRYNLTSELIASIFRTYPSVKQKHLECVPGKMTESEFWTKFFHSHYFHRDRLNTDRKDLFTECAKQDEQELKKDLASGIRDPLLDLTTFNDVNEEDLTQTATNPKGLNLAHQNMIRRFNQHSIMVLKASEQSKEDATESEAPKKRIRLQEAVNYEDLESGNEDHVKHLNLSRVERYLNGPTAVASGRTSSTVNGNGTAKDYSNIDYGTFSNLVTCWVSARTMDVIESDSAVSVLTSLSVGGSLMRGAEQSSTTHLPAEMQKELRQIYVSLSEILRHFWASFPPTTPQLIEKATRMVETLQRFNQMKISPFEQKLVRESTEAESVLRPLRQQLEAAFRKHSQWMDRRVPTRPVAPPIYYGINNEGPIFKQPVTWYPQEEGQFIGDTVLSKLFQNVTSNAHTVVVE